MGEKKLKQLITIGRRDKIDLPDLGLFDIEAKVDTGAYGCAIHSHEMQIINKNGIDVLRYKLLDPSHPIYSEKQQETADFGIKKVKSSNGQFEERYTIETRLRVFNKVMKLEFSLTNRNEMKYPILLGRQFLKNNFVVNVAKKDLSFKRKIKN